MNQYNTIGRLTKDIGFKQNQDNKSAAWGSIAVRLTKEQSIFWNFKCFGKTAELMNSYAGKKGMMVGLSGSFQASSYKDNNGNEVKENVLVVSSLSLLPNNNNNNSGSSYGSNTSSTNSSRFSQNFDKLEMPF